MTGKALAGRLHVGRIVFHPAPQGADGPAQGFAQGGAPVFDLRGISA